MLHFKWMSSWQNPLCFAVDALEYIFIKVEWKIQSCFYTRTLFAIFCCPLGPANRWMLVRLVTLDSMFFMMIYVKKCWYCIINQIKMIHKINVTFDTEHCGSWCGINVNYSLQELRRAEQKCVCDALSLPNYSPRKNTN